MPRQIVGFDVALPDFTDCSLSTREPDGDWGAVVAHGGPARAFDRTMPAFDDALSAGEASQAVGHGRQFCGERRSRPRGELNLPRPLVTAEAFPEAENRCEYEAAEPQRFVNAYRSMASSSSMVLARTSASWQAPPPPPAPPVPSSEVGNGP